jgi:colanic acid/amylovoran biosynthesis glycosyltransferase
MAAITVYDEQGANQMRTGMIGYLVSQYPAPSHTFIRREADAVRRHGLTVKTYSIRRPSPVELGAERDRQDAETTFYILPASPLIVLRAHVAALFAQPGRYIATLKLALGHRVPGLRALIWGLFHFVEAILLARQLERDGIARLHSHFGNAGGTIGMLAARFRNIPWSLTLHGISETDYPAGVLLPGKVAEAEFVACVSWFGRAQAMRITPPAHWPKLLIARCGVDRAALPARRPKAKDATPLALVCVGRLSPEKGQLGLIAALKRIRDAGHDVTLTLVGDGPSRALVDAAIATMGLHDAVRLTGRLDEAATLEAIAAADVLVLPSFMEGLPVVLMEAMALGIPVIASRVAGIPELVGDGEGLLFAPGHWDEMTTAIIRLAGDQSLRTRLSKAASAKVEHEFDIDRAVEPLITHFRAGKTA